MTIYVLHEIDPTGAPRLAAYRDGTLFWRTNNADYARVAFLGVGLGSVTFSGADGEKVTLTRESDLLMVAREAVRFWTEAQAK